MESFLASRAVVAKPNFAQRGKAGGAFTPMFAKPVEPPQRTPLVTLPDAAEAAAMAVETKPHTHAASVEAVRVDGVVQGIIVTCKCGERIELDCVY